MVRILQELLKLVDLKITIPEYFAEFSLLALSKFLFGDAHMLII